ncbi:hypothetical protein PENTCL1PPCAC_28200, partial [Pristionchus entomophagus]
FPLDELYEKLGESDKQRIELNHKRRDIRFKGDFDKHAARILKISRFCRADEEVMWLKQYRPDIPKYKCRMLEWQLLVNFDVAKTAAWRNMRKLLLPAAGQYRKSTDPAHSEICSHLFHIVCIEVMGTDRVMNRIREFVRCFSDEELSRFIHSAAEFKRDKIPTYFVGFMLLRPDLIQTQKDYIIDQMRGSPHKYRGFERICRLMAGLKFFFYTPEQADVLAESFVREIEDMYAIKEKDPLSHDLDNYGSCAKHRENEQKMFTETFPFFKEYCIKRGFCGETITNVGDLICVIPTDPIKSPTDPLHHPIRRVLTFAFLAHRRMVPSIEERRIMGMWMNDFEWDIDLNGKIEAVRDDVFSYHQCFKSLARFINRFDMKSEGFKRSMSQAGGDGMVRLVALALFYESQYEKALEIIDVFLNSRPYEEIPSLHFTRLQVLIRLKKFDEAIGIALHALIHAAKKGWTSSTTAPLLRRNARVDETDEEEECLDEYLDDDDDEKNEKKSTVHLITERDTGFYTCHLLVNLIRSRWRDKKLMGSTYYQALITLSQLNFALSGRNLFKQLISEIVAAKTLQAPTLLLSLQNRFMISTFSRIFRESNDDTIVVCEEMNQRVRDSYEERTTHRSEIIEVFQQALISATENADTLIQSISSFIEAHATDIFQGIDGNEKKDFILKIEVKNVEEEKKEKKTDDYVVEGKAEVEEEDTNQEEIMENDQVDKNNEYDERKGEEAVEELQKDTVSDDVEMEVPRIEIAESEKESGVNEEESVKDDELEKMDTGEVEAEGPAS